jgi:hypothetical protein
MQFASLSTILHDKFQIPRAWIDATLMGLNHVSPFIQKLKQSSQSAPLQDYRELLELKMMQPAFRTIHQLEGMLYIEFCLNTSLPPRFESASGWTLPP